MTEHKDNEKTVESAASGGLNETHGYVPIGAEPLPLCDDDPMHVIFRQRFGCCKGCKWPIVVCQYCLRKYDTPGT